MTALISIGGAILKTVGLNPQRIGDRSESRVPGKPTFAGMDYQLTGLGEQRIRIEFATVPLVTGGLDMLAILQALHRQQGVVPYLRLGRYYAATLVGTVVVQTLDIDESRIHPFTGVGRVVSGEADLLIVSDLSANLSGAGVTLSAGISVSLGAMSFSVGVGVAL